MTLDQLKVNESSRIVSLPSDTALKQALLEQGFVPDTLVQFVHQAPFKGPKAYKLHGTKVSLHSHVAAQIGVEVL